jgi:hypothetical protein
LGNIIVNDPEGVLAIMDAPSTSQNFKKLSSETLIATLTTVKPEALVHYLDIHSEMQLNATQGSTLIQNLALKDPQAAIDWGAKQPWLEALPQLYDSVVSGWAKADAYAASSWVTALPTGPEKDAAVVGLTKSILPSEPESALVWCASIQDPTVRAAQLNLVKQEMVRLGLKPQQTLENLGQ